MNQNFKPLGNRIVVELIPEADTTESGIVLPDRSKGKPRRGKVIAVGPGKLIEKGDRTGEREAMECKIGDEVLFGKYAGDDIKLAPYGKAEVMVMREDDVLAIVTKDA